VISWIAGKIPRSACLDHRSLKELRRAFCPTHHLVLSPQRHAVLTIRNLTARNTDRMFNHERDYSEENGLSRNAREKIGEKSIDQRKNEENLDRLPVASRISSLLFREGKQLGVCDRGAVLFNHRSDLGLANPRSRRRATRIFPARIDLRTEVDRLS
jgi:hypothetical protein